MRTVTYKAQVDLRETSEIREEIFKLFEGLIKQFEVCQIINMDETASQFDMIENKTIILNFSEFT